MKTLKQCIQTANDYGISITGDVSYRGVCNLEDGDLASFFSWVRRQYPQYHDLIFHPETEMPTNGGASYAYHAKSVAKGRVDKLPDVICLPISRGAPAFCCELKRRNIALSLKTAKQKAHFHKQLLRLKSHLEHGNVALVALGLDNLKQAFTEYVSQYEDSRATTARNTSKPD